MSTVSSEQRRFLNILLVLGIVSAIPFYTHPLGLHRPDAWIYIVVQHILPVLILFQFHRPSLSKPTKSNLWKTIKLGFDLQVILILLLGWSILLGDLHIDLTFQGFKDWSEVQIGQQIEMTELPVPGMPSDFRTIAKWVFIVSFSAPWLLWWVYVPHELVWRGWVSNWAQQPKDWMFLSTYWTLTQLPTWLLEPQWHVGWWRNNGSLFVQEILSTWLIGCVLVGIQSKHRSIILSALLVSILTISETWAILIQDTVPFPNWLWIGWNGWWGCLLMSAWLFREHRR